MYLCIAPMGRFYYPETQRFINAFIIIIIIKGQNVVLFVEHDPVYTVGIRRKGYTDDDRHRLTSLGADYIETNRGGLVTYHGPGQLVAYPIIHLKDFRLGLRQYIENLEKTIIETCRGFGVEAGITPDTGVWVEDKKIAAIGMCIFMLTKTSLHYTVA